MRHRWLKRFSASPTCTITGCENPGTHHITLDHWTCDQHTRNVVDCGGYGIWFQTLEKAESYRDAWEAKNGWRPT